MRINVRGDVEKLSSRTSSDFLNCTYMLSVEDSASACCGENVNGVFSS